MTKPKGTRGLSYDHSKFCGVSEARQLLGLSGTRAVPKFLLKHGIKQASAHLYGMTAYPLYKRGDIDALVAKLFPETPENIEARHEALPQPAPTAQATAQSPASEFIQLQAQLATLSRQLTELTRVQLNMQNLQEQMLDRVTAPA